MRKKRALGGPTPKRKPSRGLTGKRHWKPRAKEHTTACGLLAHKNLAATGRKSRVTCSNCLRLANGDTVAQLAKGRKEKAK